MKEENTVITQEFLKKRFEYRDGHLFYRSTVAPNAFKGSKAGSLKHRGYIQMMIAGKLYREHRLIFLYFHGYLPKQLDHIDRNPLNNKIDNLREATDEQNRENTNPRKGGLSVFKGVSFDKRRSEHPWRARITVNGCTKHLGNFDSEKKAAQAYDRAAIKGFGEYAHTNKYAGLFKKIRGIKNNERRKER